MLFKSASEMLCELAALDSDSALRRRLHRYATPCSSTPSKPAFLRSPVRAARPVPRRRCFRSRRGSPHVRAIAMPTVRRCNWRQPARVGPMTQLSAIGVCPGSTVAAIEVIPHRHGRCRGSVAQRHRGADADYGKARCRRAALTASGCGIVERPSTWNAIPHVLQRCPLIFPTPETPPAWIVWPPWKPSSPS